MPPVETLRSGALELLLRPAVAVREVPLPTGVAFHLSLYDAEIDARLDRLRSAACASALEPTDALVTVARDGTVTTVRGGACTFPLYWRRTDRGVVVTTALPVMRGEPLSAAGLVKAAAAVTLCSSYEPNAWCETPLARWTRVRRGTVTRLAADAKAQETPVLHDSGSDTERPLADVVAAVRTAFEDYGASQRSVSASLVELSGGFDSTLAAAAALGPGHRMYGVSAAFPYYEFRYEDAVQQAVARALGVTRGVLDGTAMFPYSPSVRPARLDEPAVFVTGIRHAECVATIAAQRGATHIYNGHGGDQLFCTDLTAAESPAPIRLSRGPFSMRAWRTVCRATAEIHGRPEARERRMATFVYDARQDAWIKETFGPVLRTPFTDLAVFRAAVGWSRYCRTLGARPDKSVLAEAAGDWLPPEVVGRHGKVAYDGVWMRAYAENLAVVAGAFERASTVLERIGLSPAWLIRRAEALAAWRPRSDREVLGAYAIASWLTAWDIERATDVTWAD